jgi:hypothetical protein
MTRRDLCYVVGQSARLLTPEQAADAWKLLAWHLEERLSTKDIPRFGDLLAAIQASKVRARRGLDPEICPECGARTGPKTCDKCDAIE